MIVSCPSCGVGFDVPSEASGKMGTCGECHHEFPIPFEDCISLLTWAVDADLRRLRRFVNRSGAAGHPPATVRRLINIVEKKRDHIATENQRQLTLSRRRRKTSRECVRSNEQIRRFLSLAIPAKLRELPSRHFERLISEVFEFAGFEAEVCSAGGDNGVDVIVMRSGHVWAVAQCKRYHLGRRVSASQVRDFIGACKVASAPRGFLFTSSEFSVAATRTLGRFEWLHGFNGGQIARLLSEDGQSELRLLEEVYG